MLAKLRTILSIVITVLIIIDGVLIQMLNNPAVAAV